ncbi:MAG: molybdate ABC transporter substrate-binding protein, partial [Vicinamibacterales bacterium]
MPLQFVALVLAVWLAPSPPAPVLVSAAISLTDALVDIEQAYRASGGGPVRFNFAGSNVLARQIANGAPADIFISADLVQMHYVERAGAIKAGGFSYLLSNRLAIVVPPDRPLGGSTAQALGAPGVKRIAIGDPAAVPAGFYARKFLQ